MALCPAVAYRREGLPRAPLPSISAWSPPPASAATISRAARTAQAGSRTNIILWYNNSITTNPQLNQQQQQQHFHQTARFSEDGDSSDSNFHFPLSYLFTAWTRYVGYYYYHWIHSCES